MTTFITGTGRLAGALMGLFGLTALMAAPALGEEEAACSAPEYRQLDFWVGTWDLTWVDKESGDIGQGSNVISRSLDGCVIEERFSGEDSMALRGMSVSNYHRQKEEWRQLWLDNTGGYLPFTGGPDGEDFVLTLERPEDLVPYRRMVWRNIAENSLDWHWQKSDDAGVTWEDIWVIRYVRRAP